ncbi:hypothetical protein MtrunA17_Chr3g0108021 [Medicago truncatula]|uniref:Uncharacterized protein n=1 Tax=Medicago truncatula TaxID=3880 RepID=A0A396IRE9_MEDTR|nr:hypothetical protein MtrunA17_Chr3g0108021 [Medicago truncatula]
MLVVCYPIMHVTGMDHVDRRRGDNLAMQASVTRECRQKAKGLVPRRRGGSARRANADDEPQHQAEPKYNQMDMDMEHQVEDDVEAEEEMGDDDDDQQQQRQRKRVPEPESEPLDDYPGGRHDTTSLTRYHVQVARATTDGEW